MWPKINHIYLSGNKLSQEEHNICDKLNRLDEQIQKMQEFVAKLQNEINSYTF